MRKFRVLTLILCLSLLATGAGAILISPAPVGNATVWGSVTEINGNTVRVQNSSDTSLSDVVIHMQETAPIIDAVNGTAIKLSDVKVNDMVYVEIGPAVAQSMPPQATGLAMITKIPADYKVPEFKTVGQLVTIDASKDGVIAELHTDDGQLLGRITKDTKLLRYTAPGQAAITSLPTVDEIVPGTGVFVWYGVSTRSIPAQATLDQVVIVPSLYDGYVTVSHEAGVSVNGTSIDKSLPAVSQDGRVLVPLRAVAEAAGWKIAYVSNDKPMVLTKGDSTVTITLGSGDVQIGETDQTLPQAVQLVGSNTYVDSLFLPLALNLYVSTVS